MPGAIELGSRFDVTGPGIVDSGNAKFRVRHADGSLVDWDVASVEPGRMTVWAPVPSPRLPDGEYAFDGGSDVLVVSGEWTWFFRPESLPRAIQPVVHSLHPQRVTPGQTLTLFGEHFGERHAADAGDWIRIGGLPTEVVSWSTDRVSVRVSPSVGPGIREVRVFGTTAPDVFVGRDLPDSRRKRVWLRGPKGDQRFRVRAVELNSEVGRLRVVARKRGKSALQGAGDGCFASLHCTPRHVESTRRTWRSFVLDIPFDSERPAPYLLTASDFEDGEPALLAHDFVRSRKPPPLPTASLDGWSVLVHEVSDRRIVLTFSGRGLDGTVIVPRRRR